MAKRFSELGIQLPDNQVIFNCPQISITDILNTEIEVIQFLPNVKTKHGEGRYLIYFRDVKTGEYGKFFTIAANITTALDQIDKEKDLPFITIIKCAKMGTSKTYFFT